MRSWAGLYWLAVIVMTMGDSLRLRHQSVGPLDDLVAAFGFVPNLFRAQSGLPGCVEAEGRLIQAAVVAENELSRRQKQSLIHAAAGVWSSDYCLALYGGVVHPPSQKDLSLLQFAIRLVRHPPGFSGADVDNLRRVGFDDAAILEAVVAIALGQFLCTLADGLRPASDAGMSPPDPGRAREDREPSHWAESPGPYFETPAASPENIASYAPLREQLGFVPGIFRMQASRPDLIEAEVEALERILFSEDHLSRVAKERIVLAVSAANLNTYAVSMQTQVLCALGASPEECDGIVDDRESAQLSSAEKVLLGEVRKLTRSPSGAHGQFEAQALRALGFDEAQIVEAVVVAGLANFLNALQTGLGATPDFPPRRVFTAKDLYPSAGSARPISDALSLPDPDAALVARVQQGQIEGFEELVRRHTRRIFGVLAGIVGNVEDARDASQEVFLKAFENIGRFQGRSKFSTWLVSIAINTGTELLRRRKPVESLDEVEDDEGFRPRQIKSWADDPEQVFSASQRSELVRAGVMRLPEKYRVAVLLRDINQLSTDEAASALELSVPALKARLLRGRLMLRESLAVHFAGAEEESRDA